MPKLDTAVLVDKLREEIRQQKLAIDQDGEIFRQLLLPFLDQIDDMFIQPCADKSQECTTST